MGPGPRRAGRARLARCDHRARARRQRRAGGGKPGGVLRPARQRGRRHGAAVRHPERHLSGRRLPAADRHRHRSHGEHASAAHRGQPRRVQSQP